MTHRRCGDPTGVDPTEPTPVGSLVDLSALQKGSASLDAERASTEIPGILSGVVDLDALIELTRGHPNVGEVRSFFR